MHNRGRVEVHELQRNLQKKATLLLKTERFLSNITFSSDDIVKVIQNLDSEKAHGHDRILIRMLIICGPSVCKPLEIIFKSCLKSWIFPLEWKKNKCCSTS